jgi:hypothetical protein
MSPKRFAEMFIEGIRAGYPDDYANDVIAGAVNAIVSIEPLESCTKEEKKFADEFLNALCENEWYKNAIRESQDGK